MMLRLALPAAAVAAVLTGCTVAETSPGKTLGTIERKDPRFDKLVPPGARLEILAEGFKWAEGPVWVAKDGGHLLFTDIPNNRVVKWQPGKGTSDFLKPSGYTGPEPAPMYEPGANGLTLDSEGRLVLCRHGDRNVARLNPDGKTLTILADKYEGKRLNSPNDLAYKSNGDLYFTDPPYGLAKRTEDPAKELPFQGVYRLGKDGKLTLLTKEMTRPNGIAFSPDEKTLYVANSDPKMAVWMAFPVKDDGTLGEGKVLFDATAWIGDQNPGLPDGLKVDKAGNIFATGPGGVLVFAPDGTHLGTIRTGVKTANCAFGGDGTVLYVTANDKLARIQTATKGW